MTVTFFGHRDVHLSFAEGKEIYGHFEEILTEHPDCTYLSGDMGRFDLFCADCVLDLKVRFPLCTLADVVIYDLEGTLKVYREAGLERTAVMAPVRFDGPVNRITLRNRWMIEQADYIVFYVNKTRGGAATALTFAQSMNKPYKNFAPENKRPDDNYCRVWGNDKTWINEKLSESEKFSIRAKKNKKEKK